MNLDVYSEQYIYMVYGGNCMKRTYSKPAMEVTEFRFSEHIATSGTTPVVPCYPIYYNVDNTGDHICDNTPVYGGMTK